MDRPRISLLLHKPENIVPNILLRLQAKQKTKDMYTTLQTAYSKISKEAKGIRQHTSQNTAIPHDFVQTSWQGHLQRISTYLEQGETWWTNTGTGEEATVCDIRTPQVSENHFRENSLQNIQNKSVTLWQKIIKTTISLPTPHLRRARIIYWY